MWKWIVGGALVLIVLLIGTCWYGYKKLTAEGDTAVVAFAATPDRVFASLADPDSMALWMTPGEQPTTAAHGMVKAGDTLRIRTAAAGRRSSQGTLWQINDVQPGRLLVVEWREDSLHRVMMVRRDSLVMNGDSTTLISTFNTPMFDSIRTMRSDSGRKPSRLLGVGEKLMVAAFRMQWKLELKRLKSRIEGKPQP